MSKSKNWCFTINNYTEETELLLSGLKNSVVYLIFGREVGDQGTPHLQGFVSYPSRKTLSAVTRSLGGAHCSIAKHITASIRYCKKDGDFVEFGEPPQDYRQGKRTDLEDFKDDVKGGITDWATLMEEHSNVIARYHKFASEYVRLHSHEPEVKTHVYRVWQRDLYNTLSEDPDDRTIIFIVDIIGNSGKSWFMAHYHSLHKDTQILLPGKKADMALALREDLRVLFVDAPRSKQGDFIQYDFLEEVKNGRIFSSKYDSRMKTFPVPHVVVAMNEFPKMDMLSEDRYKIIEITTFHLMPVEVEVDIPVADNLETETESTSTPSHNLHNDDNGNQTPTPT